MFFKRGFVALGRKDEKRNDIKSDKRTVNAGRAPWLFLRYERKWNNSYVSWNIVSLLILPFTTYWYTKFIA